MRKISLLIFVKIPWSGRFSKTQAAATKDAEWLFRFGFEFRFCCSRFAIWRCDRCAVCLPLKVVVRLRSACRQWRSVTHDIHAIFSGNIAEWFLNGSVPYFLLINLRIVAYEFTSRDLTMKLGFIFPSRDSCWMYHQCCQWVGSIPSL